MKGIAYTVTAPEADADNVLAWRAPLKESLPKLAALGYGGVELMVRGPEKMDAEALGEALREAGLEVCALGTGPIATERGLSLSAPDRSARSEAVAAGLATVRLAASLGAECVTIGSFRGRCEPDQADSAKTLFGDSLRQLLDAAAETGVRLCIEPQNRFQSSFFRTVEETCEFLAGIEDERLGLVLDSFHMNIEESGIPEACRMAGGKLFYLQWADNHRGAPGAGLFPFAAMLKALHDIRYDGWITLEVQQLPSAEQAAQAAITGAKRFLTAK